jgi:hypothetical protein
MGRFAFVSAGTALLVLLLLPAASGADATWLPGETVHPRNPADPLEPRLGLTFVPDDDRLDAALGAPVPLVAAHAWGRPVTVVLEGGAFLRLGRDGSFFPVETVDGRFGLGVETRVRRAAFRLRVMHWSAHKADGDTSVAYRGRTFSQEFAELEAGLYRGRAFAYVRAGGAWHTVPRDRGLRVATGGRWDLPPPLVGAFLAVHLAAGAEERWRADQSALIGWEFGGARRARIAVRGYRGHRPHGQYRESIESYLGFDLQFSP